MRKKIKEMKTDDAKTYTHRQREKFRPKYIYIYIFIFLYMSFSLLEFLKHVREDSPRGFSRHGGETLKGLRGKTYEIATLREGHT